MYVACFLTVNYNRSKRYQKLAQTFSCASFCTEFVKLVKGWGWETFESVGFRHIFPASTTSLISMVLMLKCSLRWGVLHLEPQPWIPILRLDPQNKPITQFSAKQTVKILALETIKNFDQKRVWLLIFFYSALNTDFV